MLPSNLPQPQYGQRHEDYDGNNNKNWALQFSVMHGFKRKTIDNANDRPEPGLKRQRVSESDAGEVYLPSSASPSTGSQAAPATPSTPDTPYTPRSTGNDRACPHCSKTFARSHVLRKHLKVHITVRNYVCDYADCKKAFRTSDDLKEHVDYNHLKEKEHTCSHAGCNAAFNNAFRLRRHEKQVHQSGIRCTRPGCDQRFRNSNTLERHLRQHDGLRPYVCDSPSCEESFDSNASLRRHRHREHKTAGPDHWCLTCDRHFKNAKSLAEHDRKSHFRCAFCEEVYDDTASLHKHLEDTHGSSAAKPDRVSCPDCPKSFSRVSNMNSHYRSVHLQERFICGQSDISSYHNLEGWDQEHGCGKKFTTKVKLVEHVKFIHMNLARPRETVPKPDVVEALSGPLIKQMEYTFRCDVPGCDSRFKRVTDLERHISSHETAFFTGEAASSMAESNLCGGPHGSGMLPGMNLPAATLSGEVLDTIMHTMDDQQMDADFDITEQNSYHSRDAAEEWRNCHALEQSSRGAQPFDDTANIDPELFSTLAK